MKTEATADIYAIVAQVEDPELPFVTIAELGILRKVEVGDDGLVTVTVTPTYSGCPATEVIESEIRSALASAGASHVTVQTRLSPPWSTDWISAQGKDKLRAYGIVPPAPATDGAQPIRIVPRSLECPRCGSRETTRLSQFGSTACKALWRCEQCKEPFEHFKPI